MKLFFSGNFPQMSKPEDEEAMMNMVHSHTNSYQRLISFYYTREAETVLNLKEKMNENS